MPLVRAVKNAWSFRAVTLEPTMVALKWTWLTASMTTDEKLAKVTGSPSAVTGTRLWATGLMPLVVVVQMPWVNLEGDSQSSWSAKKAMVPEEFMRCMLGSTRRI